MTTTVTTIGIALVVSAALVACGVAGPAEAARLRSLSDEQVATELEQNPQSAEAEYVRFILGEGGLNPPTGVTPRSLLIFAHEECGGLSPVPPSDWRRERLGEEVGFENFVHTARGFANRMICPDGRLGSKVGGQLLTAHAEGHVAVVGALDVTEGNVHRAAHARSEGEALVVHGVHDADRLTVGVEHVPTLLDLESGDLVKLIHARVANARGVPVRPGMTDARGGA